MPMLDVRSLRQFVTVAECEHIGRAAARLNISASPLSRAMRKLEDEVGLPLFERVGRGIRLTTGGRELMENARELLRASERLQADLRRRSAGDAGLVAVGHMPGALYNGVLPSAIRRLRDLHPAIRVGFEVMPEEVQLEELRNGRLDLCVGTGSLPMGDLRSATFATERYRLILPAGHPLAAVATLTRAHLAEAEWLITPPRSANSLRAKFLAACDEIGIVPRISYVAGDMISALALVAHGLGICVVQEGLAQFADRRIVVRPLPLMRLETEFRIVWRPEALHRPAERLLTLLLGTPVMEERRP